MKGSWEGVDRLEDLGSGIWDEGFLLYDDDDGSGMCFNQDINEQRLLLLDESIEYKKIGYKKPSEIFKC